MLLGQSTSDRRESALIHGYSFGRFTIDRGRGELLCDGTLVALRPKTFEVLLHLVERAGALVSRDELFKAVWGDLVVTDDSLTQCLTEIRKALGDDKRQIIRTVLRRGYIFQAEVRVEGNEPPGTHAGTDGREAHSRLPSRWTVAGLVLLGLAMAATWGRLGNPPHTVEEQASGWQPMPASIAVLPFADMSQEGDQQFLADGIAEEILNLLAQSPGLTVIARTSSFAFKDTDADIATIARRLKVAHVLEGSVRKAGDRVRVTAQLVNGVNGAHLWSETYEDGLQDVFAFQDKIARSVAEVLEVRLADVAGSYSPPRRLDFQPDPQAWELYMRGRLFYSRRAAGDRTRALRNFEAALEIDPKFAAAWVSLAAALTILVADHDVPDEERLSWDAAGPRIEAALQTALTLDPDHPEAVLRMARLKLADRAFDEAYHMIERAAHLGRNSAMVQAMLGGTAFQSGDTETALAFLERAVVLDPVNAIHQATLGYSLYASGRFAEARVALLQARELNPAGLPSQMEEVIWSYVHQGELDVAEELIESLSPGPFRDQAMAILRHLQGQSLGADEALSRLLEHPAEEKAGRLAAVYAMRGEVSQALHWLALAIEHVITDERGLWRREELTYLQNSPFFAVLHNDPRWSTWFTEARARLDSGFDQRVVAMLQSHLEAHPELYGSFSRSGSGAQ